jgi:hypothetical protein
LYNFLDLYSSDFVSSPTHTPISSVGLAWDRQQKTELPAISVMSTAGKKRPTEALEAPVAKRAAVRKSADSEVIDVDHEDSYGITVTLHSSFNVFPSLLRT